MDRKSGKSRLHRRVRKALKDILSSENGEAGSRRTAELISELDTCLTELEIENGELREIQHEFSDTLLKYSDLYNSAPVGYISINSKGYVTNANYTALRMLNTERPRLLKHSLWPFLAADAMDTFQSFLDKTFASDDKQTCEFLLRRQDGTSFPAELDGISISDAEGGRHSRIIINDITERKYAEEQRRLLAFLVENSDDAIIGLNPDATVCAWNAGASSIFAYSHDEMSGSSIYKLIPPAGRADMRKVISDVLNKDMRIKHYETVYLNKYSENVDVSITLSPIRDSRNNSIIGISMIARDISIKKQTEKALIEAKENAETATRLKSEFLANMSHEIRTPLNAVIGFADLMLEDEIREEHKVYLEMIKGRGRDLMALLGNILDLSKIESGRLELYPVPTDLKAFLNEFYYTFSPQAGEKGLRLDYTICDGVPEQITVDSFRLNQIISNITANAIKFTEQGRILLTVSVHSPSVASGKAQTRGDIRFSISDTGIGIPPEKADMIFESFSQADGSYSRKFGGAGLGLSITRKLVEMLGGSIWVESAPGKGTAFHFTIASDVAGPLPEARKREGRKLHKEQKAKPDIADTADNKRAEDILRKNLKFTVLLVEDDMMCTVLVKSFVESEGYEVHVSPNARRALEFIESNDIGLIFMDIQLPGTDGVELAKLIREREKATEKHVPIVALTAHAMEEDKKRCFDAGMDDFLSKPVQKRKLLDTLVRYVPSA